jgi:hypothetical protein
MKIDLLHGRMKYNVCLVADVAELADALDSKSGIRKGVWVRPPPSAPPQFLADREREFSRPARRLASCRQIFQSN